MSDIVLQYQCLFIIVSEKNGNKMPFFFIDIIQLKF